MINYGHTHEVYASAESDTGAVWLDGKAIYRRTVTFGAVAAGGEASASLGLGTNLGTVVSLRGMAVMADANYVIPLPMAQQTDNLAYWIGVGKATTSPLVTLAAGSGAGISSVEPFFTPSAWSLLPPQSVTTAPSKPQSLRRMSCKRWAFSLA